MNNNTQQEAFISICLLIVGSALGIGFVIYLLSWTWPYFIFYVLPCILGSMFIGFILRLLSLNYLSSAENEKASIQHFQYEPRFNYRRLAFTYGALIALVLVVFHLGSTRTIQVDKKGTELGVQLEWPRVHKTFNKLRADAYKSSWFESLRESAKQPEIYDRREIGWIAWLCLALGGPAFFLWLSRNDPDEEKQRFHSILRVHLDRQKAELERGFEWKESRAKQESQDLLGRYKHLQEVAATLRAENLQINASLEFSAEKRKKLPPAGGRGGGILDRDIL